MRITHIQSSPQSPWLFSLQLNCQRKASGGIILLGQNFQWQCYAFCYGWINLVLEKWLESSSPALIKKQAEFIPPFSADHVERYPCLVLLFKTRRFVVVEKIMTITASTNISNPRPVMEIEIAPLFLFCWLNICKKVLWNVLCIYRAIWKEGKANALLWMKANIPGKRSHPLRLCFPPSPSPPGFWHMLRFKQQNKQGGQRR